MELPFHTLDVFTDRIFGGNPLAVFPEGSGLDASEMQRIARELNLSETVFLLPPEGGGTRRARIFTPARELPFAGHPTIGAAWFLASSGEASPEADETATVVIEEDVGPIRVEVRMGAGRPRFARFETAVLPEHRAPGLGPGECAALLSLSEAEIGAPGWEPEMVSCGLPFLVVPVRDLDALARSRLDPVAWDAHLKDAWARQSIRSRRGRARPASTCARACSAEASASTRIRPRARRPQRSPDTSAGARGRTAPTAGASSRVSRWAVPA